MVFLELNEINIQSSYKIKFIFFIKCHLWMVLTFVSAHLIKINREELFLENTK